MSPVFFCNLSLEVTEERQVELDLGPQSVTARFRDALITGIGAAVDSALGVSLFIVRVAPALLLWVAVLAWPVWIAVRRGRRAMNLLNLLNPLNPMNLREV